MDLFEYNMSRQFNETAPLAARMRPESLEDFVGQEHILSKGKMLYNVIKADKLGSIILYGPPGTGKTTLARVIANTTSRKFEQLNATTSGIKDIKDVVQKAKENAGMYNIGTILFIDEIHRFNKAQQDALLPHVENGTVTLIGATTENPYFEVNNALVSRSYVFELRPLNRDDLKKIIYRAVEDRDRGFGNMDIDISDEATSFIAEVSNGDARRALNAIELAVLSSDPDENGRIKIDMALAQECIQKRALNYDRDGDNHYDTISAFIKSISYCRNLISKYWNKSKVQ